MVIQSRAYIVLFSGRIPHIPDNILDCSIQMQPMCHEAVWDVYWWARSGRGTTGTVYFVWPRTSLTLTTVAITESQLSEAKVCTHTHTHILNNSNRF